MQGVLRVALNPKDRRQDMPDAAAVLHTCLAGAGDGMSMRGSEARERPFTGIPMARVR